MPSNNNNPTNPTNTHSRSHECRCGRAMAKPHCVFCGSSEVRWRSTLSSFVCKHCGANYSKSSQCIAPETKVKATLRENESKLRTLEQQKDMFKGLTLDERLRKAQDLLKD